MTSEASSRAPPGGPCVIRKAGYGSGFDIALIVRETKAQVIVREYWLMGERWSLMTRQSHWKSADILARADSFDAAHARRVAARVAHLEWEPAVQAAKAALDAAMQAQKQARLAALTADPDAEPEGGA